MVPIGVPMAAMAGRGVGAVIGFPGARLS
jgi:hypothetical protein